MNEDEKKWDLIKWKNSIYGCVQILPAELRDNGDHTFTFVNRSVHYDRDGVAMRTENDGVTMYIPPAANFDPRSTGIRVIKKLFGKP